jgi:hypothetical protein
LAVRTDLQPGFLPTVLHYSYHAAADRDSSNEFSVKTNNN